jgi:ATPase complex subunit ATP10
MNPAGQGQHILPGGCFILKKDPKKGLYRKVILEHALGYFWAIKELASTNKKPILSNHAVIPAAEAEKFPFLGDMVSLNGEEAVSIPDFFTRNNRSKDASAKCTLVAISYKDFGAQLLPSWIDPFDRAFRWDSNETDRYEVVRIIINEGRMMKLLSPFITSGTRKSVPESDHSNTLLYYGDAEEFRDILRMHNIYTGYVFLVDGIGRVRWAGSGDGTEEEVQSMIRFAKELTKSELRRYPQNHVPRIGKRVQ